MTLKRVASPLLAAFLLAALAATAALAAAPHFAALKVSLWPEYDKPSVLVMYDITLPTDTKLPVPLDVRIPARAGNPLAVAYAQPGGNLVNAEFTYSADATWGVIHLNAMMPNIHIEYYDPALTKNGAQRSFAFHWPGGFQIDALTLVVQQPATASNIQISPVMGKGKTAPDGLVYYTAQLGALQSDQTFDVQVTYTKNNDILSANTLKANNAPAGSPAFPTEAPVQGNSLWQALRGVVPWVITALGLVLIIIGLAWHWLSTRPMPSAAESTHPRTRRPLPPEALAADAAFEGREVRYCPQCGARAHPGDKFCRQCGTRLR